MGMPHSTYYATPHEKPSEAELVAEIRAITDEFECYGYRRGLCRTETCSSPRQFRSWGR